MNHLNVEFKARCEHPERVRKVLSKYNAKFAGIDHQIDTYFNCSQGRLKLREGNIENSLIHYERDDQSGPKQSLVTLFQTEPQTSLKYLLTKALGVKIIVDKKREIYFIDNVKFHLDEVMSLGSFVEVEAIDLEGNLGKTYLQQQCQKYLDEFNIKPEQLISCSYSDLLLARNI